MTPKGNQEKAKQSQGSRTDLLANSPKSKVEPLDTREEISKLAGR